MNCMRSLLAITLFLLLASGQVKAQSPFGRIQIGRPFPDDRFPSLTDGNPASLADYRGKRVLLLVFASW